MQSLNSVRVPTSDDEGLLNSTQSKRASSCSGLCFWLGSLTFVGIITLTLSITAVALAATRGDVFNYWYSTDALPGKAVIKRIAFGSCTSHDLRPQPIWTEGVMKSEPDAWIWAGDMAYMDDPMVDCNILPGFPQCNCSVDNLQTMPFSCLVGDVDHARERMMHQLGIPEYRTFLEYMCPGSGAMGLLPPPGSDPKICPKPILGTYDDHDFGWNNGNKRLPNKQLLKNVFLDGIGELPSSPRRNVDRGLQWRYVLNEGSPGQQVDVVLLDERYYRDPLPCSVRRSSCEAVLQNPNASTTDKEYAWCRDYLLDDGDTGLPSCCAKDELMLSWCSQANSSHPFYAAMCNPTSSEFGTLPLVLDDDNATLVNNSAQLWATKQASLWPRLMQESTFCDVLGSPQRDWVRHALHNSTSPLKLVVSGSVLLGSIGFENENGEMCSGDDWECYKPAQLNLLHTLSNTTTGCVVVLAGDYHYADIKMIVPSSNATYNESLKSGLLQKPVYQIMSSGMTDSTAHPDQTCIGSFTEDLMDLRPLGSGGSGQCSFVPKANFGTVEVDWSARQASLQIRDAATGAVAIGYDGSMQELVISLDTCLPV